MHDHDARPDQLALDRSGSPEVTVPGRDGASGALRIPGRQLRPDEDPEHVQQAVRRGTSGAGGPLPHLGVIQRLFGRHDVTRVTAHVDEAAAEAARAVGAAAFATGDRVVFGSTPSLHLAAHEAAHVVQQRRGVRLAGAGGGDGDAYEQHADLVADQVVRGENVEPLLDTLGGGAAARGGPGDHVQRVKVPRPQGKTMKEWGEVDIEDTSQLPELKLLLETFYTGGPGKSDVTMFEKKLRSAVVTAIYQKTTPLEVLQQVWNLAQSVREQPHVADAGIHHELPVGSTGSSQRTDRKQQVMALNTDKVLDPTWEHTAHDCLIVMGKLFSTTVLESPEKRDRIVRAVDFLHTGGIELGDTMYRLFFLDALQRMKVILETGADVSRIRLDDQLTRLAGSKMVEGSRATFRGAIAEIFDCLRFVSCYPNRVLSLGGKKKDLQKEHYEGVEGGYVSEVDIDRTELHGDSSKWYVEVKANVSAALHHLDDVGQLDRMVSVVRQRDQLSGLDRSTAVSIVCPLEWGRLFTTPCALFYVARGIHLWIGGVTFSPAELKRIDDQIRPGGSTQRKRKHIIECFPTPRALKDNDCIFSLVNLVQFVRGPLPSTPKLELGHL